MADRCEQADRCEYGNEPSGSTKYGDFHENPSIKTLFAGVI